MTIAETWKGSGRVRFQRAENASEYIETWQLGQEQARPNDVRRFAEQGYSKNSLIYSCIREKATSFASLHPMVERRDGTVLKDHRAVRLLNDPNPYQDGQDFADLLLTQYEAAGNVYIEKHERTSDPSRAAKFAGYPVQELGLIRPDYVTIEPGATRAQDTFIVTVGGKVVKRLPRRSVIHIAEPNLTNDFYGLSKLALLVREGDIDLSMSDFELAFFRNAGVPMGLLKVKGKMTKGETAEVKSRFRAAYNGLKRWFDLLVLNADEAEYQQMGIPQAQMEGDATRFHVESRICSVFGVPGIIVGARFAMQAGSQLPYEESEHAFWAETMVPDSTRIARSLTKFLLPDFAVQADRDARITYDYTQVRALQEDRSRKLREVVRMINTGAFTVNQALTINGMPAQTDGDFYVRTGNQVIVGADGTITRMQPEGTQAPNPDNPLEGAARLNERDAVEEAMTIFRRRRDD